MGRRKRKQQTYKRVKRVPKIFTCPSCGKKSVKVREVKQKIESLDNLKPGTYLRYIDRMGYVETDKNLTINDIIYFDGFRSDRKSFDGITLSGEKIIITFKDTIMVERGGDWIETRVVVKEAFFRAFRIANKYIVECGHCTLNKELLGPSIAEPVDSFGDFIDIVYGEQELQRIEKRVEKLKKDNQWGELALNYSILSDIFQKKVAHILDDEENVDKTELDELEQKIQHYKSLEFEALLRLEEEELDRGIKTDEDSLFDEDEDKLKKEKKAEEIWDDPGFLEF